MLSDIRAWIANPQTNFGWMLIAENENTPGAARHFGSSESDEPPTLRLGYATPASAPLITGLSLKSTNLQFQIAGQPGWIYKIQTRQQVETGDWIDVTNVPAGDALGPIVIGNSDWRIRPLSGRSAVIIVFLLCVGPRPHHVR
jgi:hypothetical protein